MSDLPTIDVLTVREAADYIKMSESFLNRRRCDGGGPNYHKMGRAVRYRIADLDAWLASMRRSSTCED